MTNDNTPSTTEISNPWITALLATWVTAFFAALVFWVIAFNVEGDEVATAITLWWADLAFHLSIWSALLWLLVNALTWKRDV